MEVIHVEIEQILGALNLKSICLVKQNRVHWFCLALCSSVLCPLPGAMQIGRVGEALQPRDI